MVIINCPNCHISYNVDDDVIGMKVECESCHTVFKATDSTNISKQITKRSVWSALLSRLNMKWIALLSAIFVMIIILQTIALMVLVAQRGSVASNSNPNTNPIEYINSNLSETPSEQLLKYVELGELSYVSAVLKQNPSLDVNRPRATGSKTALYLACERGYPDLVELLLKHKADATIGDSEPASLGDAKRYSPLTIAAGNGHLAVVKVLLSSGVDIESRDASNRTAIWIAAVKNQPTVVRFLCEAKAKVNCPGRFDTTPLQEAISHGNIEVVKVLLEHGKGLDLEIRDKQKRTVLYAAVEKNNPDLVRLLCEANAKVNIYGEYDTPLSLAAKRGFTEVVKVLLKYGKGIDLEMRSRCFFSATPLYHAAQSGHTDAVSVLCEAGADLEARDGKFGDTPIKVALKNGHKDVVAVLEKYEATRQKQKRSSESSRKELDKLLK